MSDRDNGNYDPETSKKLISGIRNNLPDFFPKVELTASEKREALRDFGLQKPSNMLLADVPMAAFPSESDFMIRAVAAKIALALYYRHKGKPAGADYWLTTYWTQTANQQAMADWVEIAKDLGGVAIGQRTNTDLRNRFRYRWSVEELGQPDMFVAIVQFGDGLALCLMVCGERYWESQDDAQGWFTVDDWAKKDLARMATEIDEELPVDR